MSDAIGNSATYTYNVDHTLASASDKGDRHADGLEFRVGFAIFGRVHVIFSRSG